MSQCKMTTKKGVRCKNSCIEGVDLCFIHSKLFSESPPSRIDKIGKYVSVAGGCITVIKTAIEIWKNLPFGFQSNNDFEWLDQKYSDQAWGDLPNSIMPFNKKCDWKALRELAPALESIADHQYTNEDCPNEVVEFTEWYDSLQPEFKTLIEKELK